MRLNPRIIDDTFPKVVNVTLTAYTDIGISESKSLSVNFSRIFEEGVLSSSYHMDKYLEIIK